MKGISEYLDLHSTALSLRSKRNKVLASNIANAATPHFKARDIDFDAEMRKASAMDRCARPVRSIFLFSPKVTARKCSIASRSAPRATATLSR